MKIYTKSQVKRLDAILEKLESEVAACRTRLDEITVAYTAEKGERNAHGLGGRVPIAMARNIERLRSRKENAQYMCDQAALACGAIQNLINSGEADL